MAKLAMDFLAAHRWLLNYKPLHKLFNKLFAYRIRHGMYRVHVNG